MDHPLFVHHGIKYAQYENPDFDDLLALIKENKYEVPLAVRIDTFYCPWDKSYQMHHNPTHVLFVNGINHEDTVICTDPFYRVENREMTCLDFSKGYSGMYGVFEFFDDNSDMIDGKELLKKKLKSLLNSNIFASMRRFAKAVAQLTSASNELQNYDNAWQAPLYWHMIRLVKSRKKIPYLLNYVVPADFDSITMKWDMIQRFTLKMLVSKEFPDPKKRLVDLIYDAADLEEKAARGLLAVL